MNHIFLKLFFTACFVLAGSFLYAQHDTTLARKSYNQAFVLFKKAEYAMALQELTQAEVIYQKRENWQMYLNCRQQTAENISRQGKFDQAQTICEAALTLSLEKLPKENVQEADLRNLLGFIQLNKGRNDLALQQFNEALRLYRKWYSEKSQKTALCYTNLALANLSEGNQAQAMEFQQKALRISEQNYTETAEELADAYTNMGLVSSGQDPEITLAYYHKALKIYQKIYGDNHPKTAITYNNIALMNLEEKKYEAALKNFRQALAIRQNLNEADHPNTAFIYTNMGRIFETQEDYEKAFTYQQQALEIYQKSYGSKHPEVAHTYNFIGNIFQKKGKFAKSLATYQLALLANCPGFESENIYDNPNSRQFYNPNLLLNTLLYKAQALENQYTNKTLKRQDLNLSLKTLQICDTLIDNIRRTRTNKSDKLALGIVANEVYEQGIFTSLLLKDVVVKKQFYLEQAFHFAEKSKSAMLSASIADTKAKSFAGIPEKVLDNEKQLKADIAFYELKLAEKPDAKVENDFRNKLFDLNRRYETFIKDLEKNYPDYFNLKYNIAIPTVQQIRQHLPEQTALISYFIAENQQRIYIFLLTRSHYKVIDVPANVNFDKLLITMRNGIKLSVPKIFVESSHTLYKQLLPTKLPSGITNLVIIPDGKLGTLPFEALISKKTNKNSKDFQLLPYLLRKYAVSYNYSASLAVEGYKNKPASPTKPSILLVAPVTFGEQMAELPGTEREVQQISNLFATQGLTYKTLLRRNASKNSLKLQDLKRFQYLHFATHGTVNAENPELSQIYFSADSLNKEDGSLFAGEIYNLQISAALVVNSACQTGLGKVAKGEGLIGLSRAWLYAGAGNLLVSLWSVSDAATEILMGDFYGLSLENKTVGFSKALQTAKLKMLAGKDFNKPVYWAAFILIGK
jgi:CHAT domain-containing protein